METKGKKNLQKKFVYKFSFIYYIFSGKKVLIDEQLKHPRGIAVHPSKGQIFWTDWERTYPRIETSNMDGSNR